MSNENKAMRFYRKLYYTITDPAKNCFKPKKVERAQNQLMDFILAEKSPHELIYREIVQLFSANVLRTFPPSSMLISTKYGDANQEDVPDVEKSILFHYVFFIEFLQFRNLKRNVLSRCIDQKFVFGLLELLNNEDFMERRLLRELLQLIYIKHVYLRSYIQKCINNILFTFMYETRHHSGLDDLLLMLGGIINRFMLPLNDDHKVVLLKVLMPLHKMESLSDYHVELAFCVIEFIKKDSTLSGEILTYLLKIWPHLSIDKSDMFIKEVLAILDVITPVEFRKVMVPLFQQIAKCLSSPHFGLVESALRYWVDPHHKFIKLFTDNAATLFPIVLPSLGISRKHFNKDVQGTTYMALKVFEKMNPKLYGECYFKVLTCKKPVKRPCEKSEASTKKNRKYEEMLESALLDLPTSIMNFTDKQQLTRQSRARREIILPARFRE